MLEPFEMLEMLKCSHPTSLSAQAGVAAQQFQHSNLSFKSRKSLWSLVSQRCFILPLVKGEPLAGGGGFIQAVKCSAAASSTLQSSILVLWVLNSRIFPIRSQVLKNRNVN